MVDETDRDWKSRFESLPRKASAAPCPRAESLSLWSRGPLPNEGVDHLASCATCREEVVEVRRRLAEKGQTEPPRRALYGLMPARRIPFGWIAAAAAAAIAITVAIAFSGDEPPKAPRPLAVQPPGKDRVQSPIPPREATPPAPHAAPQPPERTAVPVPVPIPDKPPAPPTPAPVQESPAIAKPTPESEKPATVPEPVRALTRAKLKGSMLGVAGTASTQIENEAWQPLRVGQGREFMSSLKVRADVAAVKIRIGAHTYYVQRGSEISLTLEEGRTHVILARGEAFFDVMPGRDLFEVETAQGQVTVKGTRFLVAVDKNETEVIVQRGDVLFNATAIAAGERSTGAAPQKADVAKRLSWVRALEDSIWIRADQMGLGGGMTLLPDPTASGGRAIGVKDPLKAGQEALAEIRVKRKQPAPYAVWVRLHWAHGVPSALTLSVGDALSWSSKGVTANPKWQWVRVGSAEFTDEPIRVRLVDTQPGMRIDQILITSDPELNPENK